MRSSAGGRRYVEDRPAATDHNTIELFRATKNANHFNFYAGPLSASLHTVDVLVEGSVDCRHNTGIAITCRSNVLTGYQTGTRLAWQG